MAQMVKNLPAMQETHSIPGLEKSPGEENSSPLQYSCLENSMDRGACQAMVHRVAKNRTQLSNYTFTFIDVSYGSSAHLGKETGAQRGSLTCPGSHVAQPQVGVLSGAESGMGF